MSTAIASPTAVAATTVSKLQHRILPLLFLLYIVAYLDCINIGFAAFTMNQELVITSTQFGFLTGIFFCGYFLFEIPSNLILHKMGARLWIARILVSWGAIAMLGGLVHSASQLYVVRFLLGVAEAGFFPGIVLNLTYWFRQREQTQMVAWFLTGLPVATIVSARSPVSFSIMHWLGNQQLAMAACCGENPGNRLRFSCPILVAPPSRRSPVSSLGEKRWIGEELQKEGRIKSGNYQGTVLKIRFHGFLGY